MTGPEPVTWTASRIRALGAVTGLTTAGAIFGLSRNTAYHLARRGEFPVAVLRVGRSYRVSVAAILTALGLPLEPPATAETTPDGGLEKPPPGRVDHPDPKSAAPPTTARRPT